MEEVINKQAVGIRFLITVASFVIVVGGMQAAKSILIPFLLSAIIAVICAPFLLWLQNSVPAKNCMFLFFSFAFFAALREIFIKKEM